MDNTRYTVQMKHPRTHGKAIKSGLLAIQTLCFCQQKQDSGALVSVLTLLPAICVVCFCTTQLLTINDISPR